MQGIAQHDVWGRESIFFFFVLAEYLAVFSQLIAFHDPDLFNHLDSTGFHPEVRVTLKAMLVNNNNYVFFSSSPYFSPFIWFSPLVSSTEAVCHPMVSYNVYA